MQVILAIPGQFLLDWSHEVHFPVTISLDDMHSLLAAMDECSEGIQAHFRSVRLTWIRRLLDADRQAHDDETFDKVYELSGP